MSSAYRISSVLALTVFAGCTRGYVLNDGGEQGEPPVEQGPLLLSTLLDADEVEAGTAVRIICAAYTQTGEERALAFALEVDPAVQVVDAAHGFQITPVRAGAYSVRCIGDEAGGPRDERGAGLLVHPGPTAAVHTQLSSDPVPAGTKVEVECATVDVYGNPTVDGGGARVEAADAEVEGTTVSAERIGVYDVACGVGDRLDPTPAQLNVVAGRPHYADAVAAPSEVEPGDAVAMGCTVYDRFGNEVADAAPSFTVVADDGAGDFAAGIEIVGAQFSALRAGMYSVFCAAANGRGEEAEPRDFVQVRIKPGRPYAWRVAATAEACVWQGEPLPIDYEVEDFFGNAVSGVPLHIEADPAAGLEQRSDGQWVLRDEADYRLTVTLQGELHPDATITERTIDVRADSTPPTIDIASPGRAAFFESDPAGAPVEIVGAVKDGLSGIDGLTVAGHTLLPAQTGEVAVQEGEDGAIPFRIEHPSRWGLNTVAVHAIDGCGNQAVATRAYIRSESFAPAATAPDPQSAIQGALVARVGQRLLNDGDRSNADDLATMSMRVVENMDFDAFLPEALMTTPDADGNGVIDFVQHRDSCTETMTVGVQVSRNGSVVLQGAGIEHFDPIDGGLHLRFSLESISVPLRFSALLVGSQCDEPVEVATDIEISIADLVVDATPSIGLHEGGEPAVTCDGCLSFDAKPSVLIDYGVFEQSGLAEYLELPAVTRDIIDLFMPALLATLDKAAAEELPTLFADFMQTLAQGQEIPLMPPLTGAVYAAATLGSIDLQGPKGHGAAAATIDTQFFPGQRGEMIPQSAPGAILHSVAAPQDPDLRRGETFAVLLRDDFINQLFWAVWYQGAFQVDDVKQALAALDEGAVAGLGLEHADIKMSLALPPVLMPPREEVGGSNVRVGVGAVHIDATLDPEAMLAAQLGTPRDESELNPIDISIEASVVYGAGLHFDDKDKNRILLDPDTVPEVQIEVVGISNSAYQGVASDAVARMLRLLLPTLLAEVAAEPIAIPDINFNKLANVPGGGDGKVLRLVSPSFERRHRGHSRLGGAIAEVIPEKDTDQQHAANED